MRIIKSKPADSLTILNSVNLNLVKKKLRDNMHKVMFNRSIIKFV